MAKTEIGQYDETNSGNTDIDGIGLSDTTQIDQLDDIARSLMGALKRWFRVDLFRLRDSLDQTKLLALDLSAITTSTTRTVAVPDASGTMALIIDEDDFASDSEIKSPSQQSAKAYIDAKAINSYAKIATTSGTTKDFTGIPAGTKRFRLPYVGVSVDTGSSHLVQLGTSGGFVTSGYTGGAYYRDSGGDVPQTNSNGLQITSTAAASAWTGIIEGELVDAATNLWLIRAPGMVLVGGNGIQSSSTYIALASALTQIRLTTVSGSANFDAGSASLATQG